MPAFGCNRFTIPFIEAVFEKKIVVSGDGSEEDPYVYTHIGFRLSDRIVSALDGFLGQVISRFASVTYPGLNRFAFLYPFVGGTDWTHSMNLADPSGDYSKYSIIWTGTVTHNANGMTLASGAAGNTQADCGWTTGPQAENWIYKTYGLYSRTNSAEAARVLSATKTEGSLVYYQGIYPRHTDGHAHYQHVGRTSDGGSHAYVAVADSLGLYMSSRENYILLRAFKRNVQITYNNTVATPNMGTGNGGALMYITGLRNLAFVFSTKYNCFLSYNECLAFADIVQRFQVALARAV